MEDENKDTIWQCKNEAFTSAIKRVRESPSNVNLNNSISNTTL